MYTVVGKNHISGVSSKTGKPYDLNFLYCTAEPTTREKELEGLRVVELMVTAKLHAETEIGECFSDFLKSSDNLVAALV